VGLQPRGWSPDQFTDNKKPFTREELDQYAPDNAGLHLFSRSEVYLNSKAIEAVDSTKMNQPWIQARRPAAGHRHRRHRRRQRCRNAANFFDAPNGGRQPADGRDRGSQMAMLTT